MNNDCGTKKMKNNNSNNFFKSMIDKNVNSYRTVLKACGQLKMSIHSYKNSKYMLKRQNIHGNTGFILRNTLLHAKQQRYRPV